MSDDFLVRRDSRRGWQSSVLEEDMKDAEQTLSVVVFVEHNKSLPAPLPDDVLVKSGQEKWLAELST